MSQKSAKPGEKASPIRVSERTDSTRKPTKITMCSGPATQ